MLSYRSPIAALALATGLAASLAAPAFAQQAQPAQRPAAPAQQRPAAPAPAAPAQQPGQAPSGPIKLDLQPSQSEWTKVCGKDQAANKEICYTTRDFGQGADQPPVLAVAIYDVKGEDERIVRLLLPIGLMLQPGFRYVVEGQPAQSGAFAICFPNGCFAETKIKGPQVAALKKTPSMNVQVRNQVNQEMTFVIPMKDFAKAFDGAPIDPAELDRRQKELQDQLEKKSQEMRQKLEQQQGQPAPGAAPAAPKQ